MKKNIFALVGAALMLASGFMFTACSDSDDDGESFRTATMTVNLKFTDFEPASVQLTAYNGNELSDGSETVTATLATDKKSATATVSDAHMNTSGWLRVILLAKDGDDNEIKATFEKVDSATSSQVSADYPSFEFVEDGEVTLTYHKQTSEEAAKEKAAKDIEGTRIWSGVVSLPGDSGLDCVAAKDKFENVPSTVSKMTIVVVDADKSELSDANADQWINIGYENSWITNIGLKDANCWVEALNGYKYETTDATFINGVLANGLYAAGTWKLKYTVSIYCK